jgi:hypothetical protein
MELAFKIELLNNTLNIQKKGHKEVFLRSHGISKRCFDLWQKTGGPRLSEDVEVKINEALMELGIDGEKIGMKTRSAKAKGRRACEEARKMILDALPQLHPDDVRVTPASVNGVDIILSRAAKRLIPFAIEVKNQERLNVFKALEQAQKNAEKEGEGAKPLLIFRKNREPLRVCVNLSDFLNLQSKTTK